MPRPRLRRRINFSPHIVYFKPLGVQMNSLEIINLSAEEIEALRLKNIKKLDQKACAKKMNTSASTLQRILNSAYEKMTEALTEGKAIKIEK